MTVRRNIKFCSEKPHYLFSWDSHYSEFFTFTIFLKKSNSSSWEKVFTLVLKDALRYIFVVWVVGLSDRGQMLLRPQACPFVIVSPDKNVNNRSDVIFFFFSFFSCYIDGYIFRQQLPAGKRAGLSRLSYCLLFRWLLWTDWLRTNRGHEEDVYVSLSPRRRNERESDSASAEDSGRPERIPGWSSLLQEERYSTFLEPFLKVVVSLNPWLI